MQRNKVVSLSERPGGMQKGRITKYQPFPTIDLPDRQWPACTIEHPPTWCSVDLRDGNQALAIPMGIEEKLEMFDLLVKVGFKEIEVGFPSASQIEFDFVRYLIEENCIPDDVTIQVLVQAREELIARTVESLKGAKRTILHLYNSTSPLQRKVVFGLDKPEIVAIATRGTQMVKDLLPELAGTQLTFQYSPESFALTEMDFALEICEAVVDVWQPTHENKMILNLPETVQIATPNVYADQIEWFCRHLRDRESAIISLHTHNDRGTGVASTELGILAGAERVEGTLFGNGERTGNVDIVTVALNMYMQGVDPGLELSDINAVQAVYERCTRMEIPPRWPYAGELVFTAFSGSHQDAINKGMTAQNPEPDAPWEVPYLPIDPRDIGRSYEAIIRVNSQSGKGGVAYVMETEFGFQLPKELRVDFGKIINAIADETGREISPSRIFETFEQEYLDQTEPLILESFQTETLSDIGSGGSVDCTARLSINGTPQEVRGQGNGPIDAFARALNQEQIANFKVLSYAEHALGQGAEAQAVAYIQVQTAAEQTYFGAGVDTNIDIASIKALLSALNRSLRWAE